MWKYSDYLQWKTISPNEKVRSLSSNYKPDDAVLSAK